MGKYTAAHANPQGVGDARPTALQIIHDEGLEGKLADKVIVITGVTSGIGLETARALSATGATLLLTARDRKRSEAALADILEPGRVSLIDLDNSSLASVRTAAKQILAQTNNKVNIFIANAGVMGLQELTLTEDGHEMTFAVNHLSHFLLFHLLKDALLASSTPAFNSRVVLVTSAAHRSIKGLLPSDNYNFQQGGYNFGQAYAHSKLAIIYTASEIERRYGDRGLHATSVHPGGIWTAISRHLSREMLHAMVGAPELQGLWKNPEQGAATTVVAAVGKEWEGKGGKYLEDCEEAQQGLDDSDVLTDPGYVSWTYDPKEEERLWKDSLAIVGLEDDL